MKWTGEITEDDFNKAFQVIPRDQAIKIMEEKLKVFEQKYHMSSDDFYRKLISGELEETFDFGLWKNRIDVYNYHKNNIKM